MSQHPHSPDSQTAPVVAHSSPAALWSEVELLRAEVARLRQTLDQRETAQPDGDRRLRNGRSPENSAPENSAPESSSSEIQVSEEWYRLLFESYPQPAWVFDLETQRFLAVNEAAIRHYGYSRSEFLAMTIRDIRPPEDVPALLHVLGGLSPTSSSQHPHWRHRKKDGSLIEVEILSQPITFVGKRARFTIVNDVTQHKQTEVQLQITQARLQHLVTTSPAVLYSCQAFDNYAATFISDNITAMLGYRPEQFLADPDFWASRIHPNDIEQIFIGLSTLFDHGTHLHEYRFLRQDGSYLWVRDEMRLIQDAQGQPLEIVGYWIDISDRKQVEFALQSYAEELASLYNDAPCGYHSLDREGYFRRINNTELRMLGYTQEEVLGKHFSELITPESLQVFQDNFSTFKERGWVRDLEFQMRCKDGSIFPVSLNATAVKSDSGEYLFSRSAVIDIRERKQAEAQREQAEQELRQAKAELEERVIERTTKLTMKEKQLRDFFNAAAISGIGLGIHDRQKRFVKINQTLADINGAPIADHLGKTVEDMVPEMAPMIDPLFDQVLTTGQPIINLELQGSLRWQPDVLHDWLVNFFPTFAEDGSTNGLGTVVFDVSDRKQAEAALRQQFERERLLSNIVQHMRASLDLSDIINISANEIRASLQVDRVLVYRLNPDRSGRVLAESMSSKAPPILAQTFSAAYFPPETYQRMQQAPIVVPNRTVDRQSPYHPDAQMPGLLDFMEQYQVQALFIAPIIQQGMLWGTLVLHQFDQPRDWQPWEQQLLCDLANQMAIAIQQSELYEQLQTELRERRLTEEALRDSEARFRSLSESSPIGGFHADALGQLTYSNPRCQEISGCILSELLGTRWAQAVHPEDRQSVLSQWWAAVAAERGITMNLRFQHADGSIRFARVQTAPVLAVSCDEIRRECDRHQLLGYVGCVEDITDSLAIAQMKNEFISVVSHELRTPLTSLRGSLGMLASGVYDNKPEKSKRMLSIAADSADRLARLVSDILDLERLESGKVALMPQACDAAELVNQAVEGQQTSASQKQITLSVTPFHALVWAAPDSIIQTLTNLINNAIKFSEPGSTIWIHSEFMDYVGEVCLLSDRASLCSSTLPDSLSSIPPASSISPSTSSSISPSTSSSISTSTSSSISPSTSSSISTSTSSSTSPSISPSPSSSTSPSISPSLFSSPTTVPTHVLFSVRDEGRGIPTDKLESIFGQFQQVDASDSRQKGGTGLGLSICRSIIQQQGGSIWVKSSLGQGSTFYFTLPLPPREGVGSREWGVGSGEWG